MMPFWRIFAFVIFATTAKLAEPMIVVEIPVQGPHSQYWTSRIWELFRVRAFDTISASLLDGWLVERVATLTLQSKGSSQGR